MAKVRIFDSSFISLSKSASIGGDNIGVAPTHFEWTTEPCPGLRFFTDAHIKDVAKFGPSPRNIAWILEPHCLRPDPYEDALEHEQFFGMILSHDLRYSNHPERTKWKPYCYGGSWIDFEKWGMHEKTELISIIASSKNTTHGHQLRHEIIKAHQDKIEGIFGYGIMPIVSKFPVLAPYRYSIVVESCRQSSYFTEKLIDAISVGCVPIYWGAPNINWFFDKRGMIIFNYIDDLEYILTEMISERDYKVRLPFIEKNIETAKKYRICEDYIWNKYPEIFNE